eukprot:2592370-Pyramimonas_sp.AAC.1
MLPHHEWESDGAMSDAAGSSAPLVDDEGTYSDSDDFVETEILPEEEFIAEMKHLLLSRTLSARDFCVL